MHCWNLETVQDEAILAWHFEFIRFLVCKRTIHDNPVMLHIKSHLLWWQTIPAASMPLNQQKQFQHVSFPFIIFLPTMKPTQTDLLQFNCRSKFKALVFCISAPPYLVVYFPHGFHIWCRCSNPCPQFGWLHHFDLDYIIWISLAKLSINPDTFYSLKRMNGPFSQFPIWYGFHKSLRNLHNSSQFSFAFIFVPMPLCFLRSTATSSLGPGAGQQFAQPGEELPLPGPFLGSEATGEVGVS